jgi:V/A-type H+-transporting ATPase subunit F
MELAAVGRDEFVQGFKLAGIRKTVSVGKEALESSIAKVLDDPNVGILILSAADLGGLSHQMRRRLDTTPRPVVIAVGEKQQEDLREKIKRAIGVDLYK